MRSRARAARVQKMSKRLVKHKEPPLVRGERLLLIDSRIVTFIRRTGDGFILLNESGKLEVGFPGQIKARNL